MSRFRRYLPPLLLLLPLIFFCGTLLLTPLMTGRQGYVKSWEQGWPWVFREYQTLWGIPPISPGTLSPVVLSWWLLLADVVILLAAIGLAAMLLAIHYRRRGAWLRFSLREFLGLTAVLAAALGWWMSQYHVYQREQAMVRYLEFRDDETIAGGWQSGIASYEDHSPQWLRRVRPKEPIWFFRRVYFLHLGGLSREKQNIFAQEIPRRLEMAVKALPYVRSLYVEEILPFGRMDASAFSNIEDLGISLWGRQPTETLGGSIRWPNLRSLYFSHNNGGPFTDDDLECFSNCARLEQITVDGPVTDAGIKHLLKLSNLRKLYVFSAKISDAALKDLAQIQSLEYISLLDCKRITDQGIGDLARLTKDLRRISLYRIQLTDTALEDLAQLNSLEFFDITLCPNVTEHGIRRLLRLPNLKRISPRTLMNFPETEELFKQRGVLVE